MSISRGTKTGVNYYQKKRFFLDLLRKKIPFWPRIALLLKNIVVIYFKICDNGISIEIKFLRVCVMNDYLQLAEILFNEELPTTQQLEALYPPRDLKDGAKVTRVAPSPTGYLHLGTLYVALCCKMTAGEDGVFYVRIEDTDKKREIDGGVKNIIDGLYYFGVTPDEGYTANGEQGKYGPYKQSQRGKIYRAFVKELVKKGLAYPCFCTEQDLAATREGQESRKERTGYYGKYAACRNLSLEQIKEKLDAGQPYVVRLRSGGDESRKITVEDLIKGKIEMPQNDEDFVILKSDGIPTYHFAHAVDDHLMRTTHVIRGDEWVSSLPKHIELFSALGFKAPKYAHIAPIMKLDNGNKRKISKRKDPEAAVSYFVSEGYPAQSVIEYLMTVASSEFEVWRRQNPTLKHADFKFNIKKMSVSGALFDHEKLDDVSKNVISKFDAETVTEAVLKWAKEYDKDFYEKISANTAFLKGIFSIDRGVKNPRKDLAKWRDAKDFTRYFYVAPGFSGLPEHIKPADAVKLLKEYIKIYTVRDSQSEWFEDLKTVCPAANYCPDTREYRQNPQNYNGSVGDFSTVVRICITGRQNSPDLYSIMKLIGTEESLNRIKNVIRILEEA